MMFVLLLAVASALTQNFPTECGGIYAETGQTMCQLDPTDATNVAPCSAVIDICVEGQLADAGVDASVITGVPMTAVAQAYALCALAINAGYLGGMDMLYPESALYQCECDNMPEGCDWQEASQIAVSSSVCMQDTACVTAWNDIKTETMKEGVTWGQGAPGLDFPDSANGNPEYCTILQTSMTEANVKAMALGMSLFATGMAPGAGDAAVDECNDIIMETITAEVGKMVMMFALISGFGMSLATLIGTCVYFKYCKSKE